VENASLPESLLRYQIEAREGIAKPSLLPSFFFGKVFFFYENRVGIYHYFFLGNIPFSNFLQINTMI
jgi:hypothetical protein